MKRRCQPGREDFWGPWRSFYCPQMPANARMDSSVRIKATSVLYKKSIKPLIEKKRRARINASLDQLKGLLNDEGQQTPKVSKLEKADILELTVRHLQRLKTSGTSDPGKHFTDGYSHCQSTVSSFLSSVKTLDPRLQSQLLHQLEPTRSEPYAAQHTNNLEKSGELQAAAAPQIWKPQKFMASANRSEAPGGMTNMDFRPSPAENWVPPPHLWAPPPPTFKMALPPQRLSAMIAGPSAGYSEGTWDITPGLLSHHPLPVSADPNKQYIPYHEGAPRPSYPAPQLTLSSSTACAFSCSLGCPKESPMLQICHNSPRLLPGADLGWPQAQGSPANPPQVWRPW